MDFYISMHISKATTVQIVNSTTQINTLQKESNADSKWNKFLIQSFNPILRHSL